jgi:hypothetical protein
VKPVYNYTHFKRYTGILTEVEKPTIVVLTPGILIQLILSIPI